VHIRWRAWSYTDLCHTANVVLVVTACLAEVSGIEQNCDEAPMGFFVVAIQLEQAQRVPHDRVGIAGIA
jgi:hypothetical protein